MPTETEKSTEGAPPKTFPDTPPNTAPDTARDTAPDTSQTVQENISSIAALERDFEDRRTTVDRIADAIGTFSGSFAFVAVHVVLLTLWFLVNIGLLAFVPKFDPYPFILLAMIVSVEGVLLSTFVLMKQNRMQGKADTRAELDLQINLLAEKEITKTLQLLRAIATKLEIPEANDPELAEMSTITSVGILSKKIQQDLPSSD